MAKKMDKLSQDSCAALAAGMSYGKYMAAEYDGTLSSAPPRKSENPPELTGQQARPYCIRCGKPIQNDSRQRLYCGEMCRKLATAARAQEKYRMKHGPKEPVVRACAVCGKEFIALDQRKTCCGPACTKVSRVERVRRYQARKREKENAENGI